jgi:hypothetical protein
MYFDVKKVADAPVVLATWYEGFKFSEHGAQFSQETNAIFDEQQDPVFYVLDLSHLQTISIEGLTLVAHSGARVLTSTHRHPKNRETILVSKKDIVKLAVKGVASPVFGNMNIRLFETLEKALDYIRNNS